MSKKSACIRLTSSPRTVENACGVTHGTSYFHFDTKENYLRIVLKRISDFLATDFVASDGSLSENQMAMLGYQGYNSVSFILTTFSAISLLVSSVMIGILTYVSVVERPKEIGLLRAMKSRPEHRSGSSRRLHSLQNRRPQESCGDPADRISHLLLATTF